MAFSAQRKVAAASARLEDCYREGIGECHMRVDPVVFFNWVQREGPNVWNDPGFIKAFKRDNPDVRVLAKPAKVTIRRP